LGNIVANGHPNGGRFRQLYCTVCGTYFAESTGTIFYRSPLAPEVLSRIVKALAEGVNLQATARIFEVDPTTVKTCLVKGAGHMEAVSHYFIHDLHLTQVQVDELWALVGVGQAEAPPQVSSAHGHAHAWVWAAIDPVSKLLVATLVGDRSLASAQRLIHAVVLSLAPGVVPLFLSDQLVHYATALVTHFGHWVTVSRQRQRGPHPKPRWEPLPDLNYAQVVKHRVKGRVVAVTTRVVFGRAQVIRARLKSLGQTINTAFIERVNLTLRSHLPALARKVLSFAKRPEGLRQQVSLGQTYYNFCLPHATLRLALPQPRPTKGTGSPQRWSNRTPAMAAGLTHHLWTVQELLLYRVPPWRQEALG
jgi:IS1 family transposase